MKKIIAAIALSVVAITSFAGIPEDRIEYTDFIINSLQQGKTPDSICLDIHAKYFHSCFYQETAEGYVFNVIDGYGTNIYYLVAITINKGAASAETK